MTESSLTVLHISDLHFGREEHFWTDEEEFPASTKPLYDRPTLERTLLEDNDDIQHKLRPDAVVVTGDLLNKCDRDSTSNVMEFLLNLIGKLDIAKEYLFICPGNPIIE